MWPYFKLYVLPGLVGSVLLIGCVFATGSTFGQRCEAAGYEWKSEPWQQCVSRLNSGGNE